MPQRVTPTCSPTSRTTLTCRWSGITTPPAMRHWATSARKYPTSSARIMKFAKAHPVRICPHRARALKRPSRQALHETMQRARSEEHTSELQSRGHLVCRLLLEKKNETKEKHWH